MHSIEDCKTCGSTRRIWVEDDSLAKGGFYDICPRCCCDNLDGAFSCGSGLIDGICPRCDVPELTTQQEIA